MSGSDGKKFNWGRTVLIVSLGLNLAVAGIVAGTVLRFGGKDYRTHDRTHGGEFAAPYIRALSQEDRRALRRELHNSQDSRQASRAVRKQLYAKVSEALRAEPFERTRIEALLAQQQDAVTSRIAVAQGVWLNHVSEMTPEKRTAYADSLDNTLSRGFPKWKKP